MRIRLESILRGPLKLAWKQRALIHIYLSQSRPPVTDFIAHIMTVKNSKSPNIYSNSFLLLQWKRLNNSRRMCKKSEWIKKPPTHSNLKFITDMFIAWKIFFFSSFPYRFCLYYSYYHTLNFSQLACLLEKASKYFFPAVISSANWVILFFCVIAVRAERTDEST